MKTRKLGTIEVSEIGVGCMGFSHGYGAIPPEEESIAAIRAAYDAGCTFFDTAEVYGAQLYSPGHNERLLGKAVEGFRDKVVLATKFRFGADHPATAGEAEAFIRTHLAESMRNLRTDVVDLYYLHRVNRDVPVETVAEAMGKLIAEGRIRGWGLSQVGADTLSRAHAVTPVSAVQNLYNMLERDCEKEVLPFCGRHGIGLVPFSPVASGFLSGKVTAGTDFSHADDVRKFVPQLSPDNLAANGPFLELLHACAESRGATPAQVALAWMLRKAPNIVPIPGSKNRGRILENLGAADVAISGADFDALEAALAELPVHGHRGIVEYDGMGMKDWNRQEKQS